jgi:predicted NAD/FAD-dependent oxidoreductase
VRVRSVAPGRVATDAGTVEAPTIIVATSGPDAAALVPAAGAPVSKASTTWYHVADVPADALVDGRPVLTLAGDGRGPISSTVPVSHVSPAYSDGRVLVSSLAVGEHGAADDEGVARRQLASLYGVDTAGWDHVATYVVPHSLPAMPAPHDFRRPVAFGDGLYVCGDHRDSASQQGAMVSGRRAAEAVLAAGVQSSRAR